MLQPENQTMTENEIEAAAREICEAKGYDPDAPAGEHLVQWQTFRELARSTVTARTPSVTGRQPSDATKRMAKTLGTEFVMKPEVTGPDAGLIEKRTAHLIRTVIGCTAELAEMAAKEITAARLASNAVEIESAYREGYRNGFYDAHLTDGEERDEAQILSRIDSVTMTEGWEAFRG